jgi:hypothetical protein
MYKSLLSLSLLMVNCSLLLGMNNELVNRLNKERQIVLVKNDKSHVPLIKGQQAIQSRGIHADLQKTLCKQVATGLCLLSLVNAAWCASCTASGLYQGTEAPLTQKIAAGVATSFALTNAVQLVDIFLSLKSIRLDNQQNWYAAALLMNFIPDYFCSSTMGPDYAHAGTYIAALNLLAGITALCNFDSLYETRSNDKDLKKVEVIVSQKKTDDAKK